MKLKKSSSKIIVVCVIFLISMLGVSHAIWNDNLNLDATAKTGNIKLTIESVLWNGFSEFDLSSNTGEKIYFTAKMYSEEEGKLKLEVRNTGLLPVKYGDEIIMPDSITNIEVTVHPDFNDTHIYYYASNGSWEKSLYIDGQITILQAIVDDGAVDATDASTVEDGDQSQQETPQTTETTQPDETPQPGEITQPSETPQADETSPPAESTQQDETQSEETPQPTEKTQPDEKTEPSKVPDSTSETSDEKTASTDKDSSRESNTESSTNGSTDSSSDSTSVRDSTPAEWSSVHSESE